MLKELVSVIVAIGALLGGTTITVFSSFEPIEDTTPSLTTFFENAHSEKVAQTVVRNEKGNNMKLSEQSTTTNVTEMLITTVVTTKATTITTTTTSTTTTAEEATEAPTKESTTIEKSEEEISNDVFLIAYAMSKEATYGDYIDATYVGNVILNRVNDPDFPDSVYGVISQEGQYSWGAGYYSKECVYDDHFFEIAENLLAGNRPLPDNVVYQAQFIQGSGIYCTQGAHYYCYK